MGATFTGAFLATADDDEAAPLDNGEPTPPPAGDGTPPTADIFVVSMGDNFFDPAEFTVPAGATITFDISNDGSAIHNMRIAGPDGEYNTDDDTVSSPDLFMGGDAGTLVWEVPSSSGEIIFHCDFHPVEMVGTIAVQ
jgi:plastocyanin